MAKVSNNLIAVLIVIFGIIMGYNNWLIYTNAEVIAVTGQATKTVSITLTLVSPGNANATITSTAVTTATEDSLYTYQVTATDLDGDYINFFDNTTLFDINPATGLISFTPKTNNDAGNHTIEIFVFDFQGGFASQVYNLSITAVNDKPVLDFIGTITAQGGVVSTFSVNAIDEETASSDLIYNVSGVSFVNISSNTITLSPEAGDAGEHSINITVSDGSLTDSENVTIFVLDSSIENSAPTIESYSPAGSTATITADNNQTFNINFTDNDGNNTASIQWFLNGLEVTGENNNSYTFIGNFTDAGTNAGSHTIMVDVFDGLAIASHSWTLNVNITRDADGDGIPDYLDSCPFFSGTCDALNLDGDNISDAFDFLLGNITIIDKNIPLDFQVNGSTDLNKIFNETLPVKFITQVVIDNIIYNQPTVEFDFAFSNETKLNLNDITIKHFDTNNTGSVLIAGINLISQNLTKTVYMKKVNGNINGVCIKDKIISSVSEITSNCNATAETQVECDGTEQNSYTCTLNSTTNYYKIQGLNHSGGKQIDFTKPAEPSAPAEEAAAAASSAAAGGGAGGGGGGGGLGAGFVPEKIPSPIKLDTDLIKASLKEDQIITEPLRITNDGDTKLELNLQISGVEGFIFLSEDSIALYPGESKSIKLKIIGISVGVYSGKLLVKGDGISEIVRIIIDVESKNILFDIALDLIKSEISIGDNLNVKIGLINLGVPGRVNVRLYYTISDSNNNAVLKESEAVEVETQKEFIKNFKLPSDAAIGDYTISAELLYGENTAISSTLFKITKGPIKIGPVKLEFSLIWVLIILTVILIALTIINLKEHKEIKYIIKINEILDKIKYRPKEKKKFTKKDLDKQLQILKADLEEDIISEKTYDKQKKKIGGLIKNGKNKV